MVIYLIVQKATQMKRTATLITALILGFFALIQLSAQCEPDTVNCIDTGTPGQFCPMQLPDAGLNVLYDEVVTVIAPGNPPPPYETWVIYYIEIDSVKNLPPGIDYFPNADRFYPDTAYCIQLTGTPTQIGEFQLSIYIGAMVDVYGTPTRVPFVDDSSVVITVVESVSVDPKQESGFQVFQNVPNPFTDRTRMAYFSAKEEQVELSVYNILGVLVYQESERLAPGNHEFLFNGSNLEPGTYLYRVETGKAFFTGKLLKSR